jgi:hypothetical protein
MATCLGCGYCCFKAPCGWTPVWEPNGGCPHLVWDGKRYLCLQVVEGPRAEDFHDALHIGEGCCSSLNSWRRDVRYRGGNRSDEIQDQ